MLGIKNEILSKYYSNLISQYNQDLKICLFSHTNCLTFYFTLFRNDGFVVCIFLLIKKLIFDIQSVDIIIAQYVTFVILPLLLLYLEVRMKNFMLTSDIGQLH